MLKNIHPHITPQLMNCLMEMGHGDELVIADANFPSTSVADHCKIKEPIRLPGFSAPSAVELITNLMPLDGFSDYAALRMQVDNAPEQLDEVHEEVFEILSANKPDGASLSSIERQSFYKQAKNSYGVVATSEARPFGCFILRMGVVFDN